jgi:hypothetical protein
VALPSKQKIMRAACPVSLVDPIVREYMDTKPWKVIGSGVGTYESKWPGPLGTDPGYRLTVSFSGLGPDRPNETGIEVTAWLAKELQAGMRFLSGKILQEHLDKFEAAVAPKLVEAVSSGQAAANQWRPKI